MKTPTALIRPLIILILIITLCVVMVYGKSFLLPLTFGAIFAFLVNPFDNRLRKWKVNRYFSGVLSVLIIVFFVSVLMSVFGWQIDQLYQQSNEIVKELVELQEKGQAFLKNQFGITFSQQEEYADKAVEELQENITLFVGSTAGILTSFLLSLIYAILFLTEKKRISKFIYRISDDHDKMEETIEQASEVVQSYLTGKLTIIGILAIVYGIGFSIAGIQYAILIAVLTALLTFIPYAGNLLGAVIASVLTLATGGTMTEIIIVISVMSAAQFVESYILEPWIVGGNVSINPLFAIIAVIALSAVWGAGGAIIALPVFGVIKIFFEHFETYKPLAFLMDDEEF